MGSNDLFLWLGCCLESSNGVVEDLAGVELSKSLRCDVSVLVDVGYGFDSSACFVKPLEQNSELGILAEASERLLFVLGEHLVAGLIAVADFEHRPFRQRRYQAR